MPKPSRWRLLAAALAVSLPAAAPAQVTDPLLSMGVSPPVVVIDQDRLFAESRFGERVNRTLDLLAAALAEENRLLEERLMAEERALTEQRPLLAPDEFRALADAFDQEVEEIRRAQEAKSRELGDFQDAERQRFYEVALPLIAQVVAGAGAVVVLDSRAILMAVDDIDITDRVIARLDAQIGDGAAGAMLPGGGDARSRAPAPRPATRGTPADGGPPLALPDPSSPDAVLPSSRDDDPDPDD